MSRPSLLDRYVQWSWKRQRSFVDDRPRARRMLLAAGVWTAITLGWVMVPYWADPEFHPVDFFVRIVLGMLAGRGIILGLANAQAYRRGWSDGMRETRESLDAAEHEGVDRQTWRDREMAREWQAWL